MSIPAFTRARRCARRLRIGILVVSVLAAIMIPSFIVVLGLIVQLLVSRDSPEVPTDLVLGPWVGNQLVHWPFFGSYERCLLALVGIGAVAAAILATMLLWLDRLAQSHASFATSELRRAIQRQAFRLGTHDLLGTSRSRPEQLFVEQAEQLRDGLVAWWRTVPSSWVALACLLLMAVGVNFWLTLLAVVLSISLVRLHRGLRSRSESSAEHWQEQGRKASSKLLRNLGLAPLTISYALEGPPGEPFDEVLEGFERAQLRSKGISFVGVPMLLLMALWSTLFILLVVGLRDDLTVSGTAVLVAGLSCAYALVARLVAVRTPVTEADHAAAAIFAYLDREAGLGDIPQARPLERMQREVKLEQITLADRHGQRLLNDVSLRIPAGKRVAILASDPETTIALAGLFVRFYDPAAGRVLYDDHDICRATLDTVHGQALLVSAGGPIFPGSIADNIACGDSGFTSLQIADAAKAAEAYEFVQDLEYGFSTVVGDDAVTLSADQDFRIGLARALLREPSLLVIEEPPGPFDEETMHTIEKAVGQASQGRTVVLLPSMILTLRSADRVFLFHEGRLEAEGTHSELVKSSELYRHINYVRFNIFRTKVKW